MKQDRITYLESKLPKGVDIETKYRKRFDRSASYLGNGVYAWDELRATDTREFFQMDGSGNDISERELNDEEYIYQAE